MPRNISTALLDYLTSGSAIAMLVRVDRTDGVSLGFTSWDDYVIYNSLTYYPTVSLSTSAVKSNSDMTTDQLDVIGAIDSTLITEEDLDAGRYDLAVVTVMRCNPLDMAAGVVTDLYGYMGELTFGEGNVTAAVNSIGVKCNQEFGDVISPTCRVQQLGDFQCKVNLANYQHASTVAVVTSQSVLQFTDAQAAGYYDYGMVRFNSSANGGGLNHNINMEVKSHTIVNGNASLILQEPMPFTVAVGDAVILEAGCDRRSITCRNKFNNLVNIHSEPYVPGNDTLLLTGRPPS